MKNKTITAGLVAVAFALGTMCGPQGVKAFTAIFIQRTMQDSFIEEGKLEEQLNVFWQEGYDQVTVMQLDPSQINPRIYALNAQKRAEK